MKLFAIHSAVALAALCLWACGGNGNSRNASPYQGNYQGTFSSSNSGDFGTVTMSVDQNGQVRGTLVNNAVAPSVTDSMSGVIQDDGAISGDLARGTVDDPFGGNLDFNTNGGISGPIDIKIGTGGTLHTTFSLNIVFAAKKFGARTAPQVKAVKPIGKAQL